MELLNVGIILLQGVLTYYLAKRKGRQSVAMFIIGVIFGIFGIIYTLVMKHINKLNRSFSEQIFQKAKEEEFKNGTYIYALPIGDMKQDWGAVTDAILSSLKEKKHKKYSVKQSYTGEKLFITVGDSGFIQLVPRLQGKKKILNLFSFNAGNIELLTICNQTISKKISDPDSLTEIPLLFLDETMM